MIKKITRKINTIGLVGTIQFVRKRLLDNILKFRNMLYFIDLKSFHYDENKINRNVDVREITSIKDFNKNDIESLSLYGGKKFINKIIMRLESGYRLFVSYCNNDISGARWVYTGGMSCFYILPLSKVEFMCFSSFTIDKFRKQGVNTSLFYKTLKALKNEGFVQGYVFTKEWNFHQKTFIKLGFNYIGKFSEISIKNKTITIWYDFKNRFID